MKSKYLVITMLIACLMLVFAACSTPADNQEVIEPSIEDPTPVAIKIAAAASLEKIFTNDLIPALNEQYPWITLVGTYDSSGKLQTQIEEGLDADIFFSAAAKQMTALEGSGLVDSDSVVNLLENDVVLIVPIGVGPVITGFEDITNANKIAIGDPDSVPAGQYAKEVFTSLGNWDDVLKKASLGTNVTEVLSWVTAGSADAGVVYATDAANNTEVSVIAKAPEASLKTPATYPIGIVSGSENKEAAQALIDFLKSDTAKSIFEEYGFTVK